jgi:hypothetical protein
MPRPIPHNRITIKERRENILVFLTKGMKGYEIAKELGVDASTVSRDIQYLIAQSQNYLNSLAKETLPFMYQTSIEGIKNVLKECWSIYTLGSNNNDKDITWFHKIAALKLAKLKLERSIDNLSKRLDKFDPILPSSNKIGLNFWKGKAIIPFTDWMSIKNTSYALQYLPDDFDELWTCISQEELEQGLKREDVKKWDSDYLELMEYTKNPKYGKLKCFHCLLSPDGDDLIFIGINRLVSKGLIDGEQDAPQYPCQVVNKFQCPYERTDIKGNDDLGAMNSNFGVEDLFRLHEMAFAVEISLAKARKEDSKIRIKNREELLYALTDKDTFVKILDQGNEALEESEDLRKYTIYDKDYVVNYFMSLKDHVNTEGLRFY